MLENSTVCMLINTRLTNFYLTYIYISIYFSLNAIPSRIYFNRLHNIFNFILYKNKFNGAQCKLILKQQVQR